MNKEITNNSDFNNIDSLIGKLKTKDAENQKLSRNMTIIYAVMVVFYSGLFLINPDPELGADRRIGGACYALAFSIFFFYFAYYSRKLKRINYADSVKNMMVAAEKRLRPWHPNMLIVIIGALLIGVATAYITRSYLPEHWSFTNIIVVCTAIFILVIGFGLLVGHKKWRNEQRPLWIASKELLQELETEE